MSSQQNLSPDTDPIPWPDRTKPPGWRRSSTLYLFASVLLGALYSAFSEDDSPALKLILSLLLFTLVVRVAVSELKRWDDEGLVP